MVHLTQGGIVFERKNGMYVVDWDQYRHVYTTVHTKAEEERAKQVYELLRTSGFPSIEEMIHRGRALDQYHTLMLVGEVGLKSRFSESDILETFVLY